MSTIAEHIKATRLTRGLKQVELAEKVGIHTATLSRIESGERKITAQELISIAAALGVPVQALIDGDSIERVTTHVSISETIALLGRLREDLDSISARVDAQMEILRRAREAL